MCLNIIQIAVDVELVVQAKYFAFVIQIQLYRRLISIKHK